MTWFLIYMELQPILTSSWAKYFWKCWQLSCQPQWYCLFKLFFISFSTPLSSLLTKNILLLMPSTNKLLRSFNTISLKQHKIKTQKEYKSIKDPVSIYFFYKVFRLVLSRLFFNTLAIWILGLAVQSVPLSIVNALINTMPIMIFFIEAVFYKVLL